MERLIHSTGHVFSTGELHVLWRLPPESITCSCGAKLPRCAEWSAILQSSAVTAETLAELARLEALVCRTGFLRGLRFDPARIRANAEAARFLDLQRALFGGITRATGKDIIVDASKAGPRALLLSCLATPRFIHIRRDPADVIASWRSRKFDKGLGADMQRLSPVRAAEDWLKPEYFARRVAARSAVAFIDYPDFCADPRAAVSRIAGRLALDLDGIAWSGRAGFTPGPEYHSLNGNPDRFTGGPIHIAARSADRAGLSLPDRVASRLLGAIAGAIFPAVDPPGEPWRRRGH